MWEINGCPYWGRQHNTAPCHETKGQLSSESYNGRHEVSALTEHSGVNSRFWQEKNEEKIAQTASYLKGEGLQQNIYYKTQILWWKTIAQTQLSSLRFGPATHTHPEQPYLYPKYFWHQAVLLRMFVTVLREYVSWWLHIPFLFISW